MRKMSIFTAMDGGHLDAALFGAKKVRPKEVAKGGGKVRSRISRLSRLGRKPAPSKRGSSGRSDG